MRPSNRLEPPRLLERAISFVPRERAEQHVKNETHGDKSVKSFFMHAKLAEKTSRYDDMKDHVEKMVSVKKTPLDPEERRLLCAAWRHVSVTIRKSLDVVEAAQNSESVKTDEFLPDVIAAYAQKIEQKLVELCGEILKTIRERLLPLVESGDDMYLIESRALYLKMMGDYHRYQAVFQEDDHFQNSAASAKLFYEKALEVSKNLPVANIVRLEVALNFSVFYFNILNSPDKASEIAKHAYDLAVTKIKGMRDADVESNVTAIIRMLRENLSTWTSSMSLSSGRRGRSGEISRGR